jgi:uncharacterized protein (UPF0333 family)
MKRLGLSPALLVSIAALVIALGGTSYAAGVFGSKQATALFKRLAKTAHVAYATNAGNANHSKAASTVDMIKKIDFRANANTTVTVLLNTGKFKLTAACDGAGHLDLEAMTQVDHAVLMSYGNGGDTRLNDFLITGPQKLNATASPYNEERTVVYTEPGGQTVQVSYLESDSTPFGGSVKCVVSGFATIK